MRTPFFRRLSLVVAIAVAAATGWSCARGSDATTAPVAATGQSADLLGIDLGGLDLGLLSCKSVPSYSATTVIGSAGGTLTVGPHTLVVPQGALSSNVTISASTIAGKTVQVHFEPEGLKFSKSAALTMSYASCGAINGLGLKVVYVDGRTILEVLPSLPNLLNQTVTGSLSHFSNYALAD